MSSANVSSHFLTIAEVAAAMRVSKMTVYRLVKSHAIAAVRVGRSFRVPEEAVNDYIRRATEPATPDQGDGQARRTDGTADSAPGRPSPPHRRGHIAPMPGAGRARCDPALLCAGMGRSATWRTSRRPWCSWRR